MGKCEIKYQFKINEIQNISKCIQILDVADIKNYSGILYLRTYVE